MPLSSFNICSYNSAGVRLYLILIIEFAKSLFISDYIIITDIYPAREKPIKGITSNLIIDELKHELD